MTSLNHISIRHFQLGGIAYIVTLSKADLTLAVPATSGLKFAFTFAVGHFVLGEKWVVTKSKLAGIAFLAAGIMIQMAF